MSCRSVRATPRGLDVWLFDEIQAVAAAHDLTVRVLLQQVDGMALRLVLCDHPRDRVRYFSHLDIRIRPPASAGALPASFVVTDRHVFTGSYELRAASRGLLVGGGTVHKRPGYDAAQHIVLFDALHSAAAKWAPLGLTDAPPMTAVVVKEQAWPPPGWPKPE